MAYFKRRRLTALGHPHLLIESRSRCSILPRRSSSHRPSRVGMEGCAGASGYIGMTARPPGPTGTTRMYPVGLETDHAVPRHWPPVPAPPLTVTTRRVGGRWCMPPIPNPDKLSRFGAENPDKLGRAHMDQFREAGLTRPIVFRLPLLAMQTGNSRCVFA